MSHEPTAGDPAPGPPTSGPPTPGPLSPRALRIAAGVAVLVVAGVAVWTYTSGSSGVEAAPEAADPACTTLLDDLPDQLAGLGRERQGAAGVAVWGEDTIVLRCGAQVLGPTEKQCLPVGPDAGSSVDWVLDADNDRAARFLTYGREPAVEVTVRYTDGITADQATSQLVDLAAPVSTIEQTRTCV